MAQRVLLAGTSFSAVPILRAIQATGAQVTVCGNLSDDVCVEQAADYIDIDYSQADDLYRIAKDGRFDAIVPSCNDEGYLACAAVAEKLLLPGYDQLSMAWVLHSKHRFRDALQRLRLRSPVVYAQGSATEICLDRVRFPVIVKPVDNSGGKGISRAESMAELAAALEASFKHSGAGLVLIEENISGSLHSHSAFISDGEILEDFFADEYCTVYPFAVNCSNHPSFLPSAIRDEVRQSIKVLINDLRLSNGLLHTQFLRTESGAVLVESMRRCPGDLFGDMIELSNDCNYYANYVAPFLGRKLVRSTLPKAERPIARHTISRAEEKRLFDIEVGVPTLRTRVVPLHSCGAKIAPAPRDKCALVFLEVASLDALEEHTHNLARNIHL